MYLLFLTTFLLFAPALFACEDCIPKGRKTPDNTIAPETTCWSWDGGAVEGCYVVSDYSNCKMWSYTENACPVTNGGGGGGGTGGDTGGGGCGRDESGACPADCGSCGPMNDM